MSSSTNDFDEILNLVPRLQTRISVTELSGGLTNRNLKITTPTGDYVARISSNKSALLSIDRQSEYENSKIAASSGIGAEVYDFLPEFGLLVIGFIEGKTFCAEDVGKNLKSIAESCKTLHSSSPFVSDFDMFVIQQRYQHLVKSSGFRFPQNYQNYADHINQIKRAFAVQDESKVPCNNDLLPGNFINDGEQIRLIDYEYSGNNDACFELGNIWSEAKLPRQALDDLVNAYFGRVRPEKIARAWLFALLAKYGWTLWASIQSSISDLDFDFWSWGEEKYEDAQKGFASKEFKTALLEVTKKS